MIRTLFHNPNTIRKIQERLPYIFQVAEIDSSRAGKIGMEVGSLRERILIALLIHVFGADTVETEIPITEPEVDVKVNDNPISIKTITGKTLPGMKLIWTVDRENAIYFANNYCPSCDILLAHINWGGTGGLFLIPHQAQLDMQKELGRDMYLKLPKPGTNPRGVEMSFTAARQLAKDPRTSKIPIRWVKQDIDYNAYDRWLDYWNEEV